MTEGRGCGGGQEEEHGSDNANGMHRGHPYALILGLVPGIQPPRVGAVKGLLAPGRPREDYPTLSIPGPWMPD
jgi:hypothetical protein